MLSAKIFAMVAMVTQQNKVRTHEKLLSRVESPMILALITIFILIGATSCSSNKTDFAMLAPIDTLIFIESKDIGQALGAVTGSSAFKESVESLPDFSSLNGMRIGVIVTGMDAEGDSIEGQDGEEIRIKPRFVVVAESSSWFWNPSKFLEGPIADFVSDSYGKEVKTSRIDDQDGAITEWKAADGRKAFATSADDLVFFSNDLSALQLVLVTRRGERDNLSGNSALKRIRGDWMTAAGYISKEGVAQLSNLVGISTALTTTDDEDGRSFIARIIPDLLRANVKEVLWTSKISEDGIEDRYEIVLAAEVAEQMSVAMQTVTREANELLPMVPASATSVTRYDLASPSVAWGELTYNLSESTDVLNANILARVLEGVFAPYGVAMADGLASSAISPVFTVTLDESGDQVVAVFNVRDTQLLRSVVAIDFLKAPETVDSFSFWKSDDDEFAYAQKGDLVVLGEFESVKKALSSMQTTDSFSKTADFSRFKDTKGAAVTIGRDAESIEQLARALSLKSKTRKGTANTYIVSTKFTTRGILRTTSSSTGLIGSLISQFATK
jgi:hypothetical protein